MEGTERLRSKYKQITDGSGYGVNREIVAATHTSTPPAISGLATLPILEPHASKAPSCLGNPSLLQQALAVGMFWR